MGWSEKYKKSIDCNNPKGFSQRSHCQGKRKKMNIAEYKDPIKFSKFSHRTKHLGKITHQLDPNLDLKHLVHHASIEFLDKDADGDVDIFDKMNIPDESPGKDYEKTSKQLIKKQKGEIEHSKKKIAYYEGTLHHWYQGSSGKTKSGKVVKGWVQPDGSPCANEPGETKTPKCFSSARLASLKSKGEEGESIIKSALRRKRAKDKNQQAKSGASAPTNVPTFAKGKKDPNYVKAEPTIKEEMELNEARKDKPGKGSGKKDACYSKVKSRYDVWPSAYASGALVKCRKVGASNWGNKSESLNYDWDTPIRERPDRYCPKCEKLELRSECKYGPKYWDMFSLPAELISSKKDFNITMPHPGNMPEGYDHEYSMARSELSTIISAAKRLRNKMKKGEGNIEAWVQSKITKAADYIDTAADYIDSGESKVNEDVTIEDANGNTFLQIIDIIKADRLVKEGISFDVGKPSRGAGALTPSAAAQLGPKAVELQKKKAASVSLPSTAGVKLADSYKLKSFDEFMSEASPAWQRKEGKNSEGGLNKKGIASYRKENPGSNLSLAVTTEPSKLKKGSKSANRRKSFCSRMSGMKKKLTSAKTANDPDSRINKSLRKWNC
jgi:hypothetical protein